MNAPSYIFDTSSIRIVEYKWDHAQTFVRILAIPYQLQSLMIILDTWYFSEVYWLKWLILGINILLLIKFLTRFYMFVTFQYRRECSYHIEFEGRNRIKYNFSLFFSNAFNLLDLIGHVLIIIYCVIFLID